MADKSRFSLRKSPYGTWDVLASIAGERHVALRQHDSWRDAVSTLDLWHLVTPPTLMALVALEGAYVRLDILDEVAA